MPGVLFGAGLTLAASFGAGTALTRRLDVPWPVRLTAGAACFALLVLALMLTHQASRPALLVASGVCIAGICLRFPKRPDIAAPEWAILLLAAFSVYPIANALAPETEYDANTYHLQPALDARQHRGFSGRIDFFDRLPQTAEMLYVDAFAFGGSSAARLVHLTFAFAAVALIVSLGHDLGLSPGLAWTAACLFFVTPVVQICSASAFNDLLLVSMGLSAVLVVIRGGPAWLAGVLAGACFGIKPTGGIVALLGLALLCGTTQLRSAAVFAVAAWLMAFPWILRNAVETGNPLAPAFNRWFPNPWFHIATMEQLAAQLRSYGVTPVERFAEALWGWRLHGIVGPAMIAAPLVLLGWKRPQVRLLSGLAVILSVPWWLNAETRFLLLALPFLLLALSAALPRALLIVVLGAHALTSWPTVVSLYSPRSWHLYALPWKPALGLEKPDAYLARTNIDYQYSKTLESATSADSVVLDMHGVHAAHIRRTLVGSWQSALGENALRALEFARVPGAERLFELRANVPSQRISGVRLTAGSSHPDPWAVVEIELRNGITPVPVRPSWVLDAKPNRWEASFAFDGNLSSRWKTWQESVAGQYIEVRPDSPEPVDCIRIIATHWEPPPDPKLELLTPDGQWREHGLQLMELGPLDLRREAMRRVRQLGFTHIAAMAGTEGIELLGFSLADDAPYWDLDVAAEHGRFYVFRLRPPSHDSTPGH